MSRARAFKTLHITERFNRSFLKLAPEVQAQCADALEQLIAEPLAPGLHLKPIRPSNRFFEARINRSDRLILLPEPGGVAVVVDVVSHDDIGRWSK